MIIVRLITWLRSHMLLVKIGSIAVLVMLIAGDLLIPRHQSHFIGDIIPGFWAGFGFLACVLIVIISKWLGTAFLFRPDSYYAADEEGPPEGEEK